MDLRVEYIFREEMQGDTSFQEKGDMFRFIFGSTKYSKQEIREAWDSGIKHGIEIGLRRASLEGQIVELNNNTKSERHKEFLEKFHRLAAEYNCRIQYHPKVGMVVISQDDSMTRGNY